MKKGKVLSISDDENEGKEIEDMALTLIMIQKMIKG